MLLHLVHQTGLMGPLLTDLTWIPYLPEDELLIRRYRLVSFSTGTNSQVSADVVTSNAPGWLPCVIADLTIRGHFKELQVQTQILGFDLNFVIVNNFDLNVRCYSKSSKTVNNKAYYSCPNKCSHKSSYGLLHERLDTWFWPMP